MSPCGSEMEESEKRLQPRHVSTTSNTKHTRRGRQNNKHAPQKGTQFTRRRKANSSHAAEGHTVHTPQKGTQFTRRRRAPNSHAAEGHPDASEKDAP